MDSTPVVPYPIAEAILLNERAMVKQERMLLSFGDLKVTTINIVLNVEARITVMRMTIPSEV